MDFSFLIACKPSKTSSAAAEEAAGMADCRGAPWGFGWVFRFEKAWFYDF